MKQLLSEGEADQHALDFFGLIFPVTKDEFKKAFRRVAKHLHPDTSDGGAFAAEQFIKMKSFYDALIEQNPAWAFTDGATELKTVSGDLLSELGLGLGPTVNGTDCKECDHKGYREERLSGWQRCSCCGGIGVTNLRPCTRCKGSGKYTNKAGDATFDCYLCKGEGFQRHFRMDICIVCAGTGGKSVAVGKVVYHICAPCKGSGEIQIYNPVIPKGILIGRLR